MPFYNPKEQRDYKDLVNEEMRFKTDENGNVICSDKFLCWSVDAVFVAADEVDPPCDEQQLKENDDYYSEPEDGVVYREGEFLYCLYQERFLMSIPVGIKLEDKALCRSPKGLSVVSDGEEQFFAPMSQEKSMNILDAVHRFLLNNAFEPDCIDCLVYDILKGVGYPVETKSGMYQ